MTDLFIKIENHISTRMYTRDFTVFVVPGRDSFKLEFANYTLATVTAMRLRYFKITLAI